MVPGHFSIPQTIAVAGTVALVLVIVYIAGAVYR
jgi:hypothetical protein